jgi:hypothetical protein
LAWHPDPVEIVFLSIPAKRKAAPILTVLFSGGLDQHQVLLPGGLGVNERKMTAGPAVRCDICLTATFWSLAEKLKGMFTVTD